MAVRRLNVLISPKRPKKRAKISDDSELLTDRLITARHYNEHSLSGASFLSTRVDPTRGANVPTLVDSALRASARGLLSMLKVPPKPLEGNASIVGWDLNREQTREELREMQALRDCIKSLPSPVANRLLAHILRYSMMEEIEGKSDAPISVLSLSTLFLHPATTSLSLGSLSAPSILLSRLPNCTALEHLDLSSHSSLSDASLANVVAQLPTLQEVNLRGCTKIGDKTVQALSKATEHRLKKVNLSMSAVSVKGLHSLFAQCKSLEVLKLANIDGLNEKAVANLIDASIDSAKGWRHAPLSNLRTLKLRSTALTDSSLGRFLGLCSFTLEHLDISYTEVKTLDILTQALSTLPEWRLEKLVASGLPLPPLTLQRFFEPLASLPQEQRSRLKTIKLGSIASTSSKSPGLIDSVLQKLTVLWEPLELEHISLFQNWHLGKNYEALSRFIAKVGRRCKTLDLTLYAKSDHLEGLYPLSSPTNHEPNARADSYDAPALETLILDSSSIDDDAACAIAQCRSLRALHISGTRITPEGLNLILESCPLLSTLNLTSCRGIPVAERRNYFEMWEKSKAAPAEIQTATGRRRPSR